LITVTLCEGRATVADADVWASEPLAISPASTARKAKFRNVFTPRIVTGTQLAEIAALFRQDRETVKRHARNGILPGFKLGKSWFFRWSDIDQMMKDAINTRRVSN
jgi:hypothetical protein